MDTLITWLIYSLAIIISAYLIPGVSVSSFPVALVTAIVLGVVNTFIRPLLLFLSLPVNILTLGLFTFVINAVLILLVARIVPGFHVDGFWMALVFAIVLSVISAVLFSVL